LSSNFGYTHTKYREEIVGRGGALVARLVEHSEDDARCTRQGELWVRAWGVRFGACGGTLTRNRGDAYMRGDAY
jgi:hypothetical protein